MSQSMCCIAGQTLWPPPTHTHDDDDAKIMRRVINEEDCAALGQDLVKLSEWSKKWEMPFNTKKCSVLEFG